MRAGKRRTGQGRYVTQRCLLLQPLPLHNAHSSLTHRSTTPFSMPGCLLHTCLHVTTQPGAGAIGTPDLDCTLLPRTRAPSLPATALHCTTFIHTHTQDIVIPIAFPPGHGKGFVGTSGLHPRAPRMARDQGMLLFVGKETELIGNFRSVLCKCMKRCWRHVTCSVTRACCCSWVRREWGPR